MTFNVEEWTPLGRRVFIKRAAVPTHIGHIVLPPAVEQMYRSAQAEVVARGPDVHEWRLQPGMRVILRRFGAEAVTDEIDVVWETDIAAIITEDGKVHELPPD